MAGYDFDERGLESTSDSEIDTGELMDTGIDTGELSDADIDTGGSVEESIDTGEINDNGIDTGESIDSDIEDGDISDNTAEAIEQQSDYSSEVNSYIRSEDELKVYQNAGLQEAEIGDKKALIKNDIDWNMVDEKGRTNSERIERGLAPLDSDGDSIELHHVGQKVDSPLAELTFEEHRGKGNDTILHDKSIESETHAEGTNWDSERQNYWKDRAKYNNEVNEDE